jgi:hypothetical protein
MKIRTLILSVLAAGACTAGANAQTFTLDWKVNGQETVNVTPGSLVIVTGTASWNPGTYGLGGTQFHVNMAGADATDLLNYSEALNMGRNPLLRLTPQTLMDSISGGVRTISAAAGANIDAAQAPQIVNPAFSTANPIMVFTYQMIAGSAGRTITIGSDINGLTLLTSAMGQQSTVVYTRVSDGATINVVPTPGSLALLGLGGSMTFRRRRRA